MSSIDEIKKEIDELKANKTGYEANKNDTPAEKEASTMVYKFLKDLALIEKHSEIFKDCAGNIQCTSFIKLFTHLTRLCNKLPPTATIDNVMMIIKYYLNKIYNYNKIEQKNSTKLEYDEKMGWSKKLILYDTDINTKNEVYSFPEKVDKIRLPFTFHSNLMKLGENFNNIKWVNRNAHLMLASNSNGENLINTKLITFKILIFNLKSKGNWLIVPYNLSNVPDGNGKDVNAMVTGPMASAAKTQEGKAQLEIWIKGVEKEKQNLGILDLHWMPDEDLKDINSFAGLDLNDALDKIKNVFNPNPLPSNPLPSNPLPSNPLPSDSLTLNSQTPITMGGGKSNKKKSNKKKSNKKKSNKKKSNKKKSNKKKSNKKKSNKKK
jgi:hypothetical protein